MSKPIPMTDNKQKYPTQHQISNLHQVSNLQ